jgi:hypothetical protein
LWGLEPQQEPRDAAAPLYEAFAMMAGLDRPVLAPHNLRVYVSGDGRMLLIRERAGIETQAEVSVRIPEGVTYRGLSRTRTPDGYAQFEVKLRPWEGRYWRAE